MVAYVMKGGSRKDMLRLGPTEAVINEGSEDIDFRVESNGNADMLFVDGGNDNILLGTQNQGHIRLNQQLGLAVSGNVYGGMSFVTHSSNASGNRALLDFNRSRNNTIGSHTVVNSGDVLGTIVFRGDDGDEFLDACYIQGEVDGTPGDGDMPGRLTFYTTADGSDSSSERMRIDDSGNVVINVTNPGHKLEVSGDIEFSKAGDGNTAIMHVIDTADTEVAWFEGRRAGDTGAFISIQHNPATPQETNRCGIKFYIDDSAGNKTQFGGIKKYVSDVTPIILELTKKSNIIFEGAQGTMLDIDHGTSPYVTSSNTTYPGLTTGTGVGSNKINYSLGITKSYTTRVGNGPFPTELKGDIGKKIAEWGGEVGATTGRARRCGWLDLKILNKAIQLNNLNGIALTKLDVLDNLEKIKIAKSYESENESSNIEYFEVDGWKTSTQGISKLQDLPKNARNYIETIENFSNISIDLISTGAAREDIIFVNDIFEG